MRGAYRDQRSAGCLNPTFAPDTMPDGNTPVLDLMVLRRKVEGETVFDLAQLVMNAVQRFSAIGSSLIGQWQRVDKALRAATTVEELVAVDTAIIDPAEKIDVTV